MKKLIVALAVLAAASPAFAQVDEGAGDYASNVDRGNPLDVAPGVYASTAKRLADFFGATRGARTIFADDLRARIAAGVPQLIVDVRPAADYAKAHVPGAVNLPLDVLFQPDNLNLLPTDGTPVVLVCATGHTESMALGGLVALGYNPYVLRFAMMGWNASTAMKIYSNGQVPQTIFGLGGEVAK